MKRFFSIIAASAAIFASCEKPSNEAPAPTPQEPENLPINITRATTGTASTKPLWPSTCFATSSRSLPIATSPASLACSTASW